MKNLFLTFILIFCTFTVLNAQRKTAVGANLVVALPMGSFGDVAGTGIGGTATLEMGFGNNIVGMAQIGYIDWGGEEFGGYSFGYSAVPINVGTKYFFSPNSGFYGIALLGFHFFSASTEIPGFNIGGQTFGGVSGSVTSTDFSLSLGAGYELPLNKSFSLDVGGAYNIISDANYISIQAGGKMKL